MNTYYYCCLISEVKPEHYPMIFEVVGEVLNESAVINLESRLKRVRTDSHWSFFFVEPHRNEFTASHWNFGNEDYVRQTNAIYLFNPSLSLEEVLFLHSLEN